MGRVCARDLAASAVERITIADLDEEAARRVAETLDPGGDRIVVRCDASEPSAVAGLLAGADVVCNCTNYTLNPIVMRAAAAAGVHYLDLGGLYHGTRQQLELAPEVERAGVLCLLGMGSTPGTTNVMAALGASQLDEVHEIHIRCGGTDPEPSTAPLPAPYAIDTILDEFSVPAVVVADGELREVPAASADEAFDFPEPVGRQVAVTTLHSELATLPATLGSTHLRELTFKVAFGDHMTHVYRIVTALGLASNTRLRLRDGAEVVPRALLKELALGRRQHFSNRDVESLVVVLRGTRSGDPTEVRVEEVSPPNLRYQVGGADANTGIPPSIVAQMIARGEIDAVGVKAPEEVVPPEPYFRELRERGMYLNVREVAWATMA